MIKQADFTAPAWRVAPSSWPALETENQSRLRQVRERHYIVMPLMACLQMPFTRPMDVPRDQRPFQELDWARTALEAAGFAVKALTLGANPPDCVATLDGDRAGIEVTELVRAEARKRSRAGNWSLFRRDQPSFLMRVQEIIDTKAAKPFRGGPIPARPLVKLRRGYPLPCRSRSM